MNRTMHRPDFGEPRTADRLPSRLRLAGFALALLAAIGSAACAQHRLPEGPPLQVHRQPGGHRFTYNSPAEAPVWTWTGSLHPDFASTLERHPAALEAAQKTQSTRLASQILGLGFSLYGLKIALFSWETHPTLPGLKEWNVSAADWAVFGGLFLGGVVTNNMALTRLDRAVSLFNAEETASPEGASRPSSLFGSLRLSPLYDPVGHRMGVAARLTVR